MAAPTIGDKRPNGSRPGDYASQRRDLWRGARTTSRRRCCAGLRWGYVAGEELCEARTERPLPRGHPGADPRIGRGGGLASESGRTEPRLPSVSLNRAASRPAASSAPRKPAICGTACWCCFSPALRASHTWPARCGHRGAGQSCRAGPPRGSPGGKRRAFAHRHDSLTAGTAWLMVTGNQNCWVGAGVILRLFRRSTGKSRTRTQYIVCNLTHKGDFDIRLIC